LAASTRRFDAGYAALASWQLRRVDFIFGFWAWPWMRAVGRERGDDRPLVVCGERALQVWSRYFSHCHSALVASMKFAPIYGRCINPREMWRCSGASSDKAAHFLVSNMHVSAHIRWATFMLGSGGEMMEFHWVLVNGSTDIPVSTEAAVSIVGRGEFNCCRICLMSTIFCAGRTASELVIW
jgi:hypothetical protein